MFGAIGKPSGSPNRVLWHRGVRPADHVIAICTLQGVIQLTVEGSNQFLQDAELGKLVAWLAVSETQNRGENMGKATQRQNESYHLQSSWSQLVVKAVRDLDPL